MIFISPPFGNYINIDNTISIKGSYTLYPRDGLLFQIIKTLRYSSTYSGWINKIGLRNPGIDYAIKNYDNKSIVSIAILNKEEIPILLRKIPDNMNIEINISCPNTDKNMINDNIECFINSKRKWCILKLSPYCDLNLIDTYYNQGFRQFHCCNTLPVKEGGLSGKSLIPYSVNLIQNIKNKYSDTIIIGGGGIRDINDITTYNKAGAIHYSISTLFFNPFLSYSFYKNYINQ